MLLFAKIPLHRLGLILVSFIKSLSSAYQHLYFVLFCFFLRLKYLKGTTKTCVFIQFVKLGNILTCLLDILMVGVMDIKVDEYKIWRLVF